PGEWAQVSDRATLIARKQTVRQELERAQRELERLRQQVGEPMTESMAARAIARLESRSEQLMAEEFNLRLAIDRTRD
ncbi:MAG: hypothetical protein WDZ49_17420, partial [Litorilinea sp.]